MVGGDGEEGDAHQRVRPGGEDPQISETQLDAFGTAYPLALDTFCPVGPVEVGQALQQPLRVVRDAEEPLPHRAQFDLGSAALASARFDLLVRQHGQAGRTPCDRSLGLVGEARLEQAQEDPLRPAVVAGTAGGRLLAPVPGAPQPVQLLVPEVLGGARDQRRRVHALAQREVLRIDPERVESHGLEDEPAPHPLVAADDIRPAIGHGVTDVQSLS